MPQLVVDVKVNTQNKVSSNLKNNHFKMRHAPYLDRWAAIHLRDFYGVVCARRLHDYFPFGVGGT